jgi:hypothetical protein
MGCEADWNEFPRIGFNGGLFQHRNEHSVSIREGGGGVRVFVSGETNYC